MATPIRPWAAGDYRKQPVPDRQNPQRPGYSPTELMALPIAVNPHYPFLYPYTDDDNKTSPLPSTTLSSPLAPSPAAASIPEPKAKTSQGKKNKSKSAQSVNHDANGALVMAYHVNGVPMQVPASGLPHGQVLHYPQYSPYPQQAYQEICSACAGPVFQGPDGTYQPHLCPALQASYAARPASPLPGTSAMFVPRYPGELPPPEMAAGGSWAGYQYSHPGAVYEQYPQPYEYESAGVIVMPPVQAAYPQAMGRSMPAQMTPAMAAPLPSARGRISPSLEFRQPSPSPAQTMNKPKFPSVAPSQDQIAKSSSLPNLAAFHQKRASAPPSSRSTPSPPPGPQTLSQAVPTSSRSTPSPPPGPQTLSQAVPTSSRSTPSPPPGPASSVTTSSRSTPSPPPGPASSVNSSKSTPSPPPGSALSVPNSSRSTPSPPPGAQTSVSQAASGVAKSPRSTPSPPPGQLTNAAKPAQAPQPTQSPASDTQAASQPTTGPGSDGSGQRKGTNSKVTRAGPSPVSSPPSANSSLSKSPPPEASPTQTHQSLQRPSTASVVQESQNTGGDPPPSGSVRSTTPPASTASLSVSTPGAQVQQAHDLLVSIAPQRPRTPTQHKPRALPTPPGHPPAQGKDSPAMARDPKTASAALSASASPQPHTPSSTEPGQQALLPTPSVSASSQAPTAPASETEQKSGKPSTHEAQEKPAQCQEPATPTASTASKPEQDATPADAKQQTAAKRAPGKNFGARRTGFQNPLLPPLPFGQQFVTPQFGGQQFVGQQFVGQQFVGQPFVNQQFGQFGVQAPYMQPQMMQFERRGAALPAHLMPQPRTPRPAQGKREPHNKKHGESFALIIKGLPTM